MSASRMRAALPAAVLLSGCTGLFHSSAAPEQTYYLNAPAVPAASAATPRDPGPSLRVARPLGDPGLDTSHIMLLQPDHRMSFYSGSRWPAPMPQLLGALAVQTLRAGGGFGSVQDSASPFPADYILQITVRRFDADYTGGGAAPVAQVVLDCSLGRRDGREVVSSFVAAGSAPAAANRMAAVVAALEQASNTALTALAAQSLEAVRADQARAAQNGASPAPSSSRASQ